MSGFSIRKMEERDRESVFAMMRVFYDSPALIIKSPDEVLVRDIDDCLGDLPLIAGYILEWDKATAGYAMVSLSYTTEIGGICVWIEDLYVKPEYRHKGIGTEFFRFLPEAYPQAVRFKLEVEPENETAMALYKKSGYYLLGYSIMAQEK